MCLKLYKIYAYTNLTKGSYIDGNIINNLHLMFAATSVATIGQIFYDLTSSNLEEQFKKNEVVYVVLLDPNNVQLEKKQIKILKQKKSE